MAARIDLLEGGSGNDDLVVTGAGTPFGPNDVLRGGVGDDTYRVESRYAVIEEVAGEGTDKVIAAGTIAIYILPAETEFLVHGSNGAFLGIGNGLANNLYGLDADETLRGLAGDDLVFGGNGADRLEGGNGNDALYDDPSDTPLGLLGLEDTLSGGNGNDTLSVSTGTDTADGGAGNDVIRSLDDGWDDDVLTGGDGDDRFVFDPGFGFDTITDFAAGSDLIDLTSYGQGWNFGELTVQASLLDPADAVVILPSGEYVLLASFAAGDLTAADVVL